LKILKTFLSRPRARPRLLPQDQDQDQDFIFLSSRRLETKTLVSRTTSLITSEPDLVHEIEATAPLESSDHNMISWKCRVETSQNPTRLTRLNY